MKARIKLSAAITKDDARAIDVKYHLSCWVHNVQRGATSSSEDKAYTQHEANVGKVVSDIEFVSLVCTLLQAGEVVTMTDLKSAYSNMLESNGVYMKPSTRDIKEKITSHIDDVHFMKSKRRNESDRVFTTAVRDAAVEDAMAKTTESDIRQLFESASVLRAAITAQNKNPWEFRGELSNEDAEQHVPKALSAFIRWLVAGPAANIERHSPFCHHSSRCSNQQSEHHVLLQVKAPSHVQDKTTRCSIPPSFGMATTGTVVRVL